MTIRVQDIVNTMNDYLGNYTTGQNGDQNKIRAINRSIELVKQKLGLPSDEVSQSILFNEDQNYYDCSSDFVETLGVYFNNDSNNISDNEWRYIAWPQLKRMMGQYSNKRYFSYYPINGKNQLIMYGSNLKGAQTKESFDTEWTAGGDASNLTLDSNQKKEGSYSNNFDITNSSGEATVTKTGLTYDVRELHEKQGFWKVWTYLSSTEIDSITLEYGTDSSNYYTITSTTQDDGTALAIGWNKIGFSTDAAVMTGSPDNTSITYARIIYDLGAAFTSATDFRLDWLMWTFPDIVDHMYYSAIKGTDTTGLTTKTQLTELSDILSFGSFAEDLLTPIAMQAALYMAPSLRGDKEFYSMYRQDFLDILKTWSRRYPRKRIQNNHFNTILRR